VNIIDMLQEKAEAVPPSQWRTFLLEPRTCDSGRAVYRKRLPRYTGSDLAHIGYEGVAFEALYFQHVVRRGVFCLMLLTITLISLLAGIWISIKKGDISAGFTVATYASLPLGVVIALWNKL